MLSLFLYAFGSLALENGNTFLPDPTATALPAFPKCGWEGCLSLDVRFVSSVKAETYQTYPWMVEVVNSIRNSGIDVSTDNPTISTFPELQSFYSELEQNPNKTQTGVLLCGAGGGADNITNFCTGKEFEYYLVLKKINSMAVIFHALLEPFPLDPVATALKVCPSPFSFG